jgi:hypothetical protein
MNKKDSLGDRIGEIRFNNFNNKMTLVEYRDAKDITVLFDEFNYYKKTNYQNFKNGSVKIPYDKSIYGIGFIGEGEYTSTYNNIKTLQYMFWHSMMNRCYSEKFHKNRPLHVDCYVCEEWHNFQNFAEWVDENYYKVNDEIMCLDKDILVKGNKIYSPETCIFVPSLINSLLNRQTRKRGDYPIGVSKHKQCDMYSSECSLNKDKIKIGLFNTPIEAFIKYKEVKEKVIKDTAENYKNFIPTRLYEALINYIVREDD